MDMQVIFSIICSVFAIIGAGVSYYFYIRSKISAATVDAINTAEDTDKVKEEKMLVAISEINKLIPAPVKLLIPDNLIRVIIQKSFDKIEDYAKKQK